MGFAEEIRKGAQRRERKLLVVLALFAAYVVLDVGAGVSRSLALRDVERDVARLRESQHAAEDDLRDVRRKLQAAETRADRDTNNARWDLIQHIDRSHRPDAGVAP